MKSRIFEVNYLATSGGTWLSNKAIREIEVLNVYLTASDILKSDAINSKNCTLGESNLTRIATMSGFYIDGIECSISVN
jgi:hypothetical protein